MLKKAVITSMLKLQMNLLKTDQRMGILEVPTLKTQTLSQIKKRDIKMGRITD